MAMISGKQFGNYRIVRLLGQGSFASVYLGKHQYLNSYAALKVLKISLSEKEVHRFQAEAQLLVNLKHPNIIRVLEFYVEQGVPVLVMEQAPEGTLRDRYPLGTRLPLATVVSFITQTCSALQYAHNQHLIHRDVKPENMLLGSDDQLLLGDFGIALFTPSPELLSTQGFAGTLPYTPPEQLRGKPTFASDQYALGIVAYEWLCGRRPFEGAYWELIQQQMYVEPPRLRDLAADIPPAVEAVVLKALKKDDHERFVSIQAFAQALSKASRESLRDVDDAEITTPLKAMGRPSIAVALPVPPPGHPRVEPTVFLSAAPADEDIVARLRAPMQRQGISCLPDAAETATDVASLAQREAQAIRMASAVVVVVSARTATSGRVQGHLSAARMYQKHLICFWVEGTTIAHFLLDAWGQKGGIEVFDAKEARFPTAVGELITYVQSSRTMHAQDSFLPTQEQEPWEPRDPYKGLKAYTQEDVADFFGRDTLIEHLMETVRDISSETLLRHSETPLLTVIGPSGSGKSSVVMAGLLPRLKEGALPGSMRWVYLQPLMPGSHPLESLVLTLAPHFPQRSFTHIRADLTDDALRGLYLLAMQLRTASDTKVVLLIDQCEELFTLSVSEQERQHFIQLLVNAVTQAESPLIVILTLRADFSDWPMYYPTLHQVMEAHRIPILPMSLDELRAVIEQPAALPDVQLRFEGNLVGDLLLEVAGQVGALPLLAFTLDQLFQKRQGHVLTTQAYQEIGGVKGALTQQAEQTYRSLPSEEHRRLAKVLFLRLITPGQNVQETTRRRAQLKELALPEEKATTMMSAVADAFVKARLLTTNEVGGSTTIEVSHEALIREWKRLAEWLSEAREDVFLQQTISQDAEKWMQENRPVDELYTGTKLTKAQAWAERTTANRNEVLFLQASAEEQQRRAEEEQQRLRREIALKRQRVNSLYGLATVLSLLLIGSIIFAVVLKDLNELLSQKILSSIILNEITSSRALAANASYALAQNQLDLSLLLSIQAEKTRDTFEGRNSLLNALEQSPQILTILRGESNSVRTLVFSHDSSILFSSDGFIVYKWDTTGRNGTPVALKGNPSLIGSTAVSPDNRTLLTSSASGVLLWDIQTGKPTQLAAPAIPALLPSLDTTVAFSPDGTLVASGQCSQQTLSQGLPSCLETSISVWNVQSTKSVGSTIVVPANVKSIAFTPDGQSLVTASHAGIQFWDRATGQAPGPVLVNSAGANSIAFSPDGKTLAAGNEDKTVQLWDVATEAPLGIPFTGHTGPVLSVAFSPDGKRLASASEDKTVILWDVATGQSITSFARDDAQPKTSVAFSPDGKTLASGNQDGNITLWSIEADSPITHRLTDIGGLESALFTPDGLMVLTGSENGKVLLQDAKTGKLIDTLNTSSYPLLTPQNAAGKTLSAIQSLALSGTTVAAGRLDGTIIVWNLQTRKFLALFKHPALLHKISLSSDGHILASGGDGGTIMLWDVAKQAPLRSLHVDYRLSTLSVALSPDGTLLAAGNCGKQSANGGCQQPQVLLWEAHTGKLIDHLAAGNIFDILDVAFSSDGNTLAASSNDGIRLWDVTTRKPIGPTLSIPGGNASLDYYSNILFSPDGTKLTSYSASGSPFDFVLWDVKNKELFAHPLSEDGSFQGSVAFSPDGRQLASVFDRAGKHIFLLWDITIASWQDRACRIANRNLTQDEWDLFVKDGNRRKVCPDLPLE